MGSEMCIRDRYASWTVCVARRGVRRRGEGTCSRGRCGPAGLVTCASRGEGDLLWGLGGPWSACRRCRRGREVPKQRAVGRDEGCPVGSGRAWNHLSAAHAHHEDEAQQDRGPLRRAGAGLDRREEPGGVGHRLRPRRRRATAAGGQAPAAGCGRSPDLGVVSRRSRRSGARRRSSRLPSTRPRDPGTHT